MTSDIQDEFQKDYASATYLTSIWSRDLYLILLSGDNLGGSIGLGWNRQCENTKLILDRMELISIPLVEITELKEPHPD